MRLAAFIAGAVLFSGAAASPLERRGLLGFDLSQTNNYGAPIPPWGQGTYPGWYNGDHPDLFPGIPCLSGVRCHPPSSQTSIKFWERSSSATSLNCYRHSFSVLPRPHPRPPRTGITKPFQTSQELLRQRTTLRTVLSIPSLVSSFTNNLLFNPQLI